MRKISCGVSGSSEIPATHKFSEIPVKKEIVDAFLAYYKKDLILRPAQDQAIFTCDLLQKEDNVIIATPTNSGKSLLSYLILFQDAVCGKRTVLVEPLRVLAYEKAEELKAIAEILRKRSHIKVRITISTGDYRLTDEFMGASPEKQKAEQGEIVVATPERLDAISRVSKNSTWFEKVSIVCFDEAHLIGDSTRGPTLELLIAFLRTMTLPPRIVLMSATIANPDALSQWLAPCSVINAATRFPQLEKWVYCIDADEDTNEILVNEIQEVLQTEGTSIIVFVYQTAHAESLACRIAKALSGKRIAAHDLSATMAAGVAWFHSNMSAATKYSIINAMESGAIRVTVSTTALSMGINLPATHVYVRDVTFTGFKDLDVSDLLQMLGRAGRGSRSGTGVVFLSKSNLAKESTIVAGLTSETLPTIRSGLLPRVREDYYGSAGMDLFYLDRVGSQVIGAIHRFKTTTYDNLCSFLHKTLCGDQYSGLDEILRYLVDWKLVYQDEVTNEYALTALGQVSSKCYFPPLFAANIGQLIRDLLSDEPSGKHVDAFTQIDFLIVLCLVSKDLKPLARYSKKMETNILSYMEALPLDEKSYLYRTWISSSPEMLWGSARVDYEAKDEKKQVLPRVYTAMFLYDLSKGKPAAVLDDYYGIDSEEIQEKYRDNAIWLISGIRKLLEVRCFFYHLKENCKAEADAIHGVETAFKNASRTAFKIIENLKFRSRLGELVRGIKQAYPHADSYPGEGTIKHLEAGGITSLKDLVKKQVGDLVGLGVKQQYAEMIIGYVRKRLQ